MRAVAAPQTYSRNGFCMSTPAEVFFSGEDWGSEPDSETASKENGNMRRSTSTSGCKTQKRSARTSAGDPHLAQASLMSEMPAVPSAPSTTGKRRTGRNGSPHATSMEEDGANLLKRSLTSPTLRSPAQRRSKSRGELTDSVGIESRATKASPPPRHVEHRVPKRTPRLSPRGALPGHGRLQATKIQSPTSSAFRSAVGPTFSPTSERESTSEVSSARRDIYDVQQFPGEVHHGVEDLGTTSGSQEACQPLVACQTELITTPPVPTGPSTTASPHNSPTSPLMSPSCRETCEVEFQNAVQSASLSGATTPTESCDVPLLRLRPDSKAAQVHDSRIMKLIGRRSVLYASDATTAGFQAFAPRRRDRDHRPQRCPLSRNSVPASPSSPPKTGSRQIGTPAGNTPQVSSLSGDRERVEASSDPHACTPSASSGGGNANLGKANRRAGIADDENSHGSSHTTNLVYPEASDRSSPSSGNAIINSPTTSVGAMYVGGDLDGHGGLGMQAPTESLSSTAPNCYPLEVDEYPQGLLVERPPTSGGVPSDRVVTNGETVDENVLLSVLAKDAALDQLSTAPSAVLGVGAQNTLIWPGHQMPAKQEMPPLEATSGILLGSSAALTGYPVAHASLLPGVMPPRETLEGDTWLQEPMTLLQNEVGSIIMPHTWHYVSPPQLPPGHQVQSPESTGCVGTFPTSENRLPDPTSPMEVTKEEPMRDRMEEVPILKSCDKPLDVEGKRLLLSELVECLATRAHKAEQAFGTEQRANRAMQVTLEVLQRQNLCLQQQLSWVTQSWPYGNLSLQMAEDGSTVVASTIPAVAQGSANA